MHGETFYRKRRPRSAMLATTISCRHMSGNFDNLFSSYDYHGQMTLSSMRVH